MTSAASGKISAVLNSSWSGVQVRIGLYELACGIGLWCTACNITVELFAKSWSQPNSLPLAVGLTSYSFEELSWLSRELVNTSVQPLYGSHSSRETLCERFFFVFFLFRVRACPCACTWWQAFLILSHLELSSALIKAADPSLTASFFCWRRCCWTRALQPSLSFVVYKGSVNGNVHVCHAQVPLITSDSCPNYKVEVDAGKKVPCLCNEWREKACFGLWRSAKDC